MKKRVSLVPVIIIGLLVVVFTCIGISVMMPQGSTNDPSTTPDKSITIDILGEEVEIKGFDEVFTWTEDLIPEDPVLPGYEFEGWYKDEAFKEPYNFDSNVMDSLTLYAKFEPAEYEITLVLNGGKGTDKIIGKYNEPVYPPTDPKRSGYMFAGWYQDEQFKTSYNFDKMPLDGTTIYAKWISNIIDFRITDTAIEWKYRDEADTKWRELVKLSLITGPQGVSVSEVYLNDDSELIVILSNGNETNLGSIKGETGEQGIGIEDARLSLNGELVIVLTNGEEINLGKVVGPQGEVGPEGKPGKEVEININEDNILEWKYTTDEEWIPLFDITTLQGKDGLDGTNGIDGVNGKSAYEVAKDNGFLGTEAEWLASLIGVKGQSAYEIAKENGYIGTEAEWLGTLVGAKGEQGIQGLPGKSAYDLAKEAGFEGTLNEWLASLIGAQGATGAEGAAGKSAYELAVDQGYKGSLDEWLASLVGEAGQKGDAGLDGQDGKNGLSAYEIAKANGFLGTEAEWLSSLSGKQGDSAYQVAVKNGFDGTIEEWLLSLKGRQIELRVENNNIEWRYTPTEFDDPESEQFQWKTLISLDELKGAEGRGIERIYYNELDELVVDYTDGTTEVIDVAVKKHTITFVGLNGNVVSIKNVLSGKTVATAVAPTIEGYNFKGWYQDPNFDELYDFDKEVTENITLYAKYEIETYLVTYLGLNDVVIATYNVEYGKNAPLPDVPTLDGYLFVSFDKPNTNILENTTIKAIYNKVSLDTYTVIFKDSFGNILDVQSVEHGKAATLPEGVVAPNGYKAVGWNGEYESITSDVTIVLEYEKLTYTVTFKNGTATLKTETVEFGASATAPNEPTKVGHTFVGWNKDFTNVRGNLTVDAKFEINKYNVVFNDFYGRVISIQVVEFGQDATLPTLPSVPGKKFIEWDQDHLEVSKDLTINPVYENILYTVVFKGAYGKELERFENVAYGDAVVPTETPTLPGHYFAGWSVDTSYVTSHVIAEPIFEKLTYTVTFKNIDGSILKVYEVKYEDALEDYILVPDLKGYKNERWSVTDFSKITSDVEVMLLADYEQFTVTFKVNGSVHESKVYNYGDYATSVAPTIEGSTFVGWDQDLAYITSDITTNAIYVKDAFNVIFVDDEGNVLDSQRVLYGEDALAPNEPTKVGYAFDGWDTTYTNVTKNLVVKAVFKQNTFVVKFIDFDERIIASSVVGYNEAAIAPDAPTRNGYVFTGWSVDFQAVTEPLLVYAQYERAIKTVTLMNGFQQIAIKEFTYQSIVRESALAVYPEIEGYDFVGWYQDEELTEKFDFGKAGHLIKEDLTLYAKYEIKKYTVTFDLDGGLLEGVTLTQTVEYGKNATLPSVKPVKDGYTFVTWDKDGTNILEDTTIKALYEIIPTSYHVVTFKDEFGSILKVELVESGKNATYPDKPEVEGYKDPEWVGSITSVTEDRIIELKYQPIMINVNIIDSLTGASLHEASVQYGKDLKIPSQVYNKEGYEFVGFDRNVTNIKSNSESIIIRALYRKLEYTVTFYDYSGHIVKIQTVEHGSHATAPTLNGVLGRTQKGWTEDFSKVTKDLEVEPIYEVNTYKVIFYDIDGEQIGDEQVVKYGQAAEAPNKGLEVIGMNFIGWNQDYERVTSDLHVYAQYEDKMFTVVFKYNNLLIETKVVKYGAQVTAPKHPTVEGYEEAGWDQDLNYVTSNLVVNAKYTPKEYTVTFVDPITKEYINCNGVPHGTKAEYPEALEKTGYTFIGYDRDINHVTEDMTVNLIYVVNEYTISFVFGNYVYAVQKLPYGAKIQAPDDPTRVGYTFKEWNGLVSTMPAKDLVVNAVWTVNTYTVKFFEDAEKQIKLSEQEVEYGKAASAPSVTALVGKTFIKWNTSFDEITGDLDVVAEYVDNYYDVVVKNINNAIIGTYSVKHGQTLVLPEVAEIEGYTFKGFGINNDTKADVSDEYINVQSDATLYAIYEAIEYEVSFVVEGIAYGATQKVYYGQNAKAPVDPEVTGKVFIGWDTSLDNITSDLTVTAIFKTAKHTVNFYNEFEELVDVKVVEYGSCLKDTVNISKNGYTFAGWKVEKTSTIFNLTNDQVTKDLNLYAKFTPIEVKYNFDTDGNGIADIQNSANQDEVIPYPENNPTKPGYTFVGWEEVKSENNEITLEAKFEINKYVVTFLTTDGRLIQTQTVEYNSQAYIPKELHINHMTFLGWYIDKDKTNNPFNFENGITEDVLVYAHYEAAKRPITISFITNLGVVDIQIIEYGKTVTLPSVPLQNGYTFDNWYIGEDVFDSTSELYEDTVITGKYVKNVYTVVFKDHLGNIIEIDLDNDQVPDEVKVEHGMGVNAPTLPDRVGYKFIGWSSDINNVTGDTTFEPIYEQIKFNVTLVDDQGLLINKQVVNYGDKVAEPINPYYPGKVFVGWFTKNEAEELEAYNFDAEVKKELEIIAVYKTTVELSISSNANSYFDELTLEFTGTSIQLGDAKYAEIINAASSSLPNGFSTPKLLNAKTKEEITATTEITSDLEIIVTYFVEVTLNDQETKTVKQFEYNKNVVLTDKDYELIGLEGHTFVGWFLDKGFTKPYNFETPLQSSITLYAKYEINKYTVVVKDNNGKIINQQIVEHGKHAVNPGIEEDGYILSWINTDNTTFDFNDVVTSNLELTAHWEFVEEPIEFVTNYTGAITYGDAVIRYDANLLYNYDVKSPTNKNGTVTIDYKWYHGDVSDENLVKTEDGDTLSRKNINIYNVADSGVYNLIITMTDSSKGIRDVEFEYETKNIEISKRKITPTFYRYVDGVKEIINEEYINILYKDLTIDDLSKGVHIDLNVPEYQSGQFYIKTHTSGTITYYDLNEALEPKLDADPTFQPGYMIAYATIPEEVSNWELVEDSYIGIVIATVRVGDQYFVTLDEAMAYANFGDTVVVERPTILNQKTKIKPNVTLYMEEGSTISGNGSLIALKGAVVYEPMKLIGLSNDLLIDVAGTQMDLMAYLWDKLQNLSVLSDIVVPHMFPFESYELNSIRVPLTIEYGAEYRVNSYIELAGESITDQLGDVETIVPPIVTSYNGDDTEGIILLGKNAFFTKNYIDNEDGSYRIQVELNGNVYSGQFNASITLKGNGMDLFLQKENFPFKLLGTVDAYVKNGTLRLNNSIEYLNGATVTIEEDATVYFDGLDNYHIVEDKKLITSPEGDYYTQQALFINKGIMFINGNFGGTILPYGDKAQVIINENADIDGNEKFVIADFYQQGNHYIYYRSLIPGLIGGKTNQDMTVAEGTTTFEVGNIYNSILTNEGVYEWSKTNLDATLSSDRGTEPTYGLDVIVSVIHADGTGATYEYTWYKLVDGEWVRVNSVLVDSETNLLVLKDVVDSGTYKVVFTATYEGYSKTGESDEITINIQKATPQYDIPQGITATYGDTLSSVVLPDGFKWQEELNTKVGDAGSQTHKVTYTPDNPNNYNLATDIDVTITVAKAIPQYTVPTELTATYKDLLSSINLPDGWTFDDLEGLSEEQKAQVFVGNAGTRYFDATFTPELAGIVDHYNYETITVRIAVEVSKKSPEITFDNVEGIKLPYTGNNYVIKSGFEYINSLDILVQIIENKEEGYDGDLVYVNNVLKDAGTYIITIIALETANYNSIQKTITVEIEKAEQTIDTSNIITSLTYNGIDQSFGYATAIGNVKYYLVDNDAETEITSLTNANPTGYTIKIVAEATDNYKEAEKEVIVYIQKADSIIDTSSINTNLLYTSLTYNLGSANLTQGVGTLTYKLDNSENLSEPLENVSLALGSHTLTISTPGDVNYNPKEVTLTIKVEKAETIFDISNLVTEYVYDGQQIVIQGLSINHDTEIDYAEIINAGTYVVVATVQETEFYQAATIEFEITVDKAQTEFDLDALNSHISNLEYDSEEHSVVYVNSQYLVKFAENDERTIIFSNEYYREAGTYTLVIVTEETPNYYGKVVTVTYEVKPCNTTISVNGIDDANNRIDLTYTGLVPSFEVSTNNRESDLVFSYKLTNSEDEFVAGLPVNVGRYEIKVSQSATNNYKEQSMTFELSVGSAQDVITANPNQTYTYTGSQIELTVSNLFGELNYSYKVDGSNDEFVAGLPMEVGTYIVKVQSENDPNGNYTVTSKEILVTIVPKETTATVVTENTNYIYNPNTGYVYIPFVKDGDIVTEHTLNIEITDGDENATAFVYPQSVFSEVGTYNVMIIVPASGNYSSLVKNLTVVVGTARIDNVIYPTVDDAIVASNYGDVIELVANSNIDLTSEIPEGRTIITGEFVLTINTNLVNNGTLLGNLESRSDIINNGIIEGNLRFLGTITNNNRINVTSDSEISNIIENANTTTISNGSILVINDSISGNGKIEVLEGTLQDNTDSVINLTIVVSSGSVLNNNGTTIVGEDGIVRLLSDSSTVTIEENYTNYELNSSSQNGSDGSFYGLVEDENCSVVVKSGSFDIKSSDDNDVEIKANITVQGGSLVIADNAVINEDAEITIESGSVVIHAETVIDTNAFVINDSGNFVIENHVTVNGTIDGIITAPTSENVDILLEFTDSSNVENTYLAHLNRSQENGQEKVQVVKNETYHGSDDNWSGIYTITFVGNGSVSMPGNVTIETMTVIFGKTFVIESVAERENYDFQYWYTYNSIKQTDGQIYYSGDEIVCDLHSDLVLYAIWNLTALEIKLDGTTNVVYGTDSIITPSMNLHELTGIDFEYKWEKLVDDQLYRVSSDKYDPETFALTLQTVAESGTYRYTVIADDGNEYFEKYVDISITIRRADTVINNEVIEKVYTFNGSSVEILGFDSNNTESTPNYSYRIAGSEDDFTSGLPTNKGTYEIKVTQAESANYNYGEETFEIEIIQLDITGTDTITLAINNNNTVFTGQQIKPIFDSIYCVKDGLNLPLTEVRDYTLKVNGSENMPVNFGSYAITIEGNGNYTGTYTHQVQFVIEQRSLADYEYIVEGIDNTQIYTGLEIVQDKLNITISFNNDTGVVTLNSNDFIISGYENNTNVTRDNNSNVIAGAIVYLQAANNSNYKDTLEVSFTINPKNISEYSGNVNIASVKYGGIGVKLYPTVTITNLTIDEDFTVTNYINNENVYIDNTFTVNGAPQLTINGVNNYTGSFTKNFVIEKANTVINDEDIEKVYTFNGSSVEILEFDSNNTESTPNYSYRIAGSEDDFTSGLPTNKGTYEIKVTQAESANYNYGEETFEIEIIQLDITGTDTITLAINNNNTVFTGQQIKPIFDSIYCVKDGLNLPLTEVRDYTLKVNGSENMPVNFGSYTITIEGNGNYTGTYTHQVQFVIVQKDISIIVDNKTKSYGEEDPQFTATALGWLGTSDEWMAALDPNNGISTFTRAEGTNVGQYQISMTFNHQNYKVISNTPGTLTIEKLDLRTMVSRAQVSDYPKFNRTYHYPSVSIEGLTLDVDYQIYTYYNNYNAYEDSTFSVANAPTIVIRGLTDNITGDYAYIPFIIHKATPVISTELGGTNNQPITTLNESALIANGRISVLDLGYFEFSVDPKAYNVADGEYTQYGGTYTVTFVVTDTTNLNQPESISVEGVKIFAAAKIDSTYYPTIEEALLAAKSGDVVNVIVGGDPVINSDCVIPAGVTLNIPYGYNSNGTPIGNSETAAWTNPSSDGTAEHDYILGMYKSSSYGRVTSTVTVVEGVTITNLGTIVVGGMLTGSNGGATMAGHTVHQWAELILEKDVQILSTGDITSYGYIKESYENNGSMITMDGTLTMPFVLRDFYGGSAMYALYDSMDSKHSAAFNQFEFRNVTPKIKYNYGSTLYGIANLYAGDKNNSTTALVISDSGSGAMIEMTNATYSYIESKYARNEVCHLDIYGGAKSNSLTLTIDTGIPFIGTKHISTNNVVFPISWRYSISLNKHEDQESNAQYVMSQSFKIMTGAEFIINAGAVATVTELIVYEKYDQSQKGGVPSTIPVIYPVNLPAGRLVVNGTLNCEKLAGIVHTYEDGALINVTKGVEITSNEPHQHSGSSIAAKVDSWFEITETMKLYLYSNRNSSEKLVASGVGKYYGYGAENGAEGYWLSSSDKIFNINYVPIYFDVTGPETITHSNPSTYGFNDNLSLSDGTIENTTFKGWYLDPECTISISILKGIEHLSDLTIYGKFVEPEPTVTITFVSGKAEYNITAGVVPISDLSKYTLPDLNDLYEIKGDTSLNYYFDGWYSDDSLNNEVSSITYNGEEEIILYAKWSNKYSVTFGSMSNATVTLTYTQPDDEPGTVSNGTIYLMPDTKLQFAISYSEKRSKSFKIDYEKNTNTNINITDGAESYTVDALKDNIKAITASSKSSCVAAGTLVTMADGSQKLVEDIKFGDIVLVFNHETGEIEPMSIMYNAHDELDWDYYDIINLEFSDGTILRIITEHGAFDTTLNRYVFINKETMYDYIGHTFYKMSVVDGEYVRSDITLVNAYMSYEYTGVYNPITYYHLNFFGNGLLTTAGNIGDLINNFEYDYDLSYNEESYKENIEKYGIYTYEELSEYYSEEVYNSIPVQYVKIAVGKGIITWEEAKAIIDEQVRSIEEYFEKLKNHKRD